MVPFNAGIEVGRDLKSEEHPDLCLVKATWSSRLECSEKSRSPSHVTTYVADLVDTNREKFGRSFHSARG